MTPDGLTIYRCGACGEDVPLAVKVTPGYAIVGEEVEPHQCRPQADPAATIRP